MRGVSHFLCRAFGSRRLQWINEASKILLVDTSLAKVAVSLPRLNKRAAILNLDPSSPSIKPTIDNFAYQYGTTLVFRSSEGAQFSATTPPAEMLKEPFFIDFANTLFCVFPMNYNVEKMPMDQETKVTAEKYMIERGLSESTSSTLASFNTMMEEELRGREKVSIDLLQVSIKKVLTARSLQREYHEDYMIALYNIFKAQYARELTIMTEIDKRATRSANRWIRSFWQILLGQFFFTQYGTYYLYSWDIMEPITCMMTMGDTAAAYFFWIFSRGQSYDVGGIWQYFYQRKRAKLLKKHKLNPSEMAYIQGLLAKLVPHESSS